MENKIDIIIPWVDGADENWLKEKSKYSKSTDADDNINRYRDWDLLKYWFRSIEKFAPWVNKIHFITFGHLPCWLNTENNKINIVKHSDYIPKKYLPVFSSHPIELNMFRIEGLSDKFIYFNDDTYLLRAIHPEDFFKNNLPVDNVKEVALRFFPDGIDHIIGNDMTLINKNFKKREVIKKNRKQWFSLKSPIAFLKNLYMLPVNGFSAFENPHIPVPFLKSTLKEVWEKEYETLDLTCSNRFRSNGDVNQWLFRYWQFAKGSFVQSKGPEGIFCSIGRDDAIIKDTILNQKQKMICLSDDNPHIDFYTEQKFLVDLLEKILPEKSSFEK